MGTPMDEQETSVCAGRAEATVQIYTTNTVHLKKLRADRRVAEVKGGDDWGQFTIPSSMWDPVSGIKRTRRPMTDEEKAAASARLAEARSKRGK